MKLDLERYLNGNPAMREIWFDAMNRIEAQIPLAPAQRVIVGEWLTRVRARLSELQLKSQKTFMRDEEYAEMAALWDQVEKFRFIERQ